MARKKFGIGKKFTFHGAYKKKSAAVRKEKSIGGFIRKTLFCRKKHCHTRFLVLKEK